MKQSQLEKALAQLKDERRVLDLAIQKLEAQRQKPAPMKVLKTAKPEGQKP